MNRLFRSLAAALLACAGSIGAPDAAAAQVCGTGKPCGDACIAREKTCRVGAGGARAGEASPILGAPGRPCVVARVVDGDTLDCMDGRRIRLLLIDAPEMGQGSFGAAAKEALESLAGVGEPLAVENDVDIRDRYGRELAHLYRPDGSSVNRALLLRGVAIVSVYPPNVNHVERYRAAQDSARAQRRGLWAVDAFACSPADYRAGRCGRR